LENIFALKKWPRGQSGLRGVAQPRKANLMPAWTQKTDYEAGQQGVAELSPSLVKNTGPRLVLYLFI
jgi:hypothetical protein